MSDIHLISIFNPLGGGPWHALELYRELSHHRRVHLWAACREPAAEVRDRYPFRMLEARRGRFPWHGTFIFVGAYFPVGRWLWLTAPRRVILVYNSVDPEWLGRMLPRLRLTRRPVEFVYRSPALRDMVGVPGEVHPSTLDLARFHPPSQRAPRPFTVGRLSRDDPGKHHPDDADLYRRLAAEDMRVRIMGGLSLHRRLGDVSGIELLPENAERAESFLHRLDCLLYRTSPQVMETFGRVVFEAMACGLPVVCGRQAHYTEWLRHGENSLLFDTTEEALAHLRRLRSDPGLADRLRQGARQTLDAMYHPDAVAERLSFFLR